MTDYGHELLFGTFITPASSHPEAVVVVEPGRTYTAQELASSRAARLALHTPSYVFTPAADGVRNARGV